MKEPGFLRSSLVVFLVANLGSMFGFLFQIGAAHILAVEQYGTLFSLMSLGLYLAIFGQPLQLVFARRAGGYLATGEPGRARALARQFLVLLTALSVIYLLLLPLVSGPLCRALHLESSLSVWLAAGLGLATLYFFWVAGLLQSRQWFLAFSLAHAGHSLVKLLFGVGLALTGVGALGVLGGVAAAPLVVAVIALIPSLRSVSEAARESNPVRYPELLRELVPLTACFGGFLALANLDVLFVKAYFDGEIPGQYSAAVVLGRTVFYLPLAVVNVTFSKVARAHARGESHARYLLWNLLFTTVLSGLAALVLWQWAGPILEFYGGSKFISARSTLAAYTIPMCLYGVGQVFMHYFLALGRRSYAWILLIAIVLAVLLFEIQHEDVFDIIRSMNLVGAVWVLMSLGYFVRNRRQHRGTEP